MLSHINVEEEMREYMKGDIKLIVMGNTNAGKSTFLNMLIGMPKPILNTGEVRETSCFWRIKFIKDKQPAYKKYVVQPKYNIPRGKYEPE